MRLGPAPARKITPPQQELLKRGPPWDIQPSEPSRFQRPRASDLEHPTGNRWRGGLGQSLDPRVEDEAGFWVPAYR